MGFLECYFNQLTALDVTKNTDLEELYCHNNQLATLDLTKNTDLKILDCSNNQLRSVSLGYSTQPNGIECAGNRLTEQAFYSMLRFLQNCNLYVKDFTNSNDQNIFTNELVLFAYKSGCKPYYFDGEQWREYGEMAPTGIFAAGDASQTGSNGAPRYNLQGQRVGTGYRGVVVTNGRKVRTK